MGFHHARSFRSQGGTVHGAALPHPNRWLHTDGATSGLQRGPCGDSGVVAEAMSEEEEGDDAPIIRLVSKVISEAVEQDVSDIHVEPMEDAVRIRFRKDGVLREVASHPGHLHGPLSSRLKIMASMDILLEKIFL